MNKLSDRPLLLYAAQLSVVLGAAIFAWSLFSLADQWLAQTDRPHLHLTDNNAGRSAGAGDPLVAEGALLLAPAPCAAAVAALVAVVSHAAHRRERDAQRRAWPAAALAAAPTRAARVFVLARPPHNALPPGALAEEQRRHGDLLQGDWDERYRSLLRKHLLVLRWFVRNCSQAEMVLKMDDDIAVDIPWILKEARNRTSKSKGSSMLFGHVLDNAKPHRTAGDKWYLSREEYPNDTFPRFVSGWAYVATSSAAKKILDAAATASGPSLWIDDVYVTGVLAAASGVRRAALSRSFASDAALLRCCLRAPALLCDYAAGPDGGDPALTEAVAAHARRCARTGARSCAARAPARALNRTCVRALPPPDAPRLAGPAAGPARVRPVRIG